MCQKLLQLHHPTQQLVREEKEPQYFQQKDKKKQTYSSKSIGSASVTQTKCSLPPRSRLISLIKICFHLRDHSVQHGAQFAAA